jgi:hypothetical protein
LLPNYFQKLSNIGQQPPAERIWLTRMFAKTSYVIRLSEDLYLDSNNNFLTGALPNLPVYALAGGDLPLSDDTRKALLRQILAVLPEDDPRWKTVLRSIGIGAELTD